MSNFTDFISGGGGSASFPTIFLSKSQTWVPPQDGNIMIHVIGGGGSGSSSNSNTNSSTAAGGGGAGGYCRKNSLAVTTSGSYTVVIGAGHQPTSVQAAGGNGGNTTFAGTGLSATLTANGGTGHPRGDTANSATGGSASGGDVNNTGGAGSFKKGGGAVGITGTGNQGFDGSPSSSGVYFGGACDVIGDFWSSSLGQLAGSIGGVGVYASSTALDGSRADAGPLAGGGGAYVGSGYYYPSGGAATIGGGGGPGIYSQGTWAGLGGRGGEGIVVIQYIP